jgi:hypothetical protein
MIMENSYTFLSEKEPSDKQLQDLMKAVLIDVKNLSEIGEEKLKTMQLLQISEAKKYIKNRIKLK